MAQVAHSNGGTNGSGHAQVGQVVKTTYRCHQPDGSIVNRSTFRCPMCVVEEAELADLVVHMRTHHGYNLPGYQEPPPVQAPAPSAQASKGANIVITRLRLPNGEYRLVCPMCEAQFPVGEEEILEHVAVVHGQVWASSDGKVTGTSDRLDHLHQALSENWYSRRDEAMRRLQVVSLGSFCGVKFSIQRLGLGNAHLPFDWIRTTSAGVRQFVSTGFQNFFCIATQQEVPSVRMKMFRSEMHSFWHDDVSNPEARAKLQRRIDRFQSLEQEATDILFIRSIVTTEEVLEVEELYRVLQAKFGRGQRRVLLAVAVVGQDHFVGPLFHESVPGIIFFLQPCASHDDMMEGRAFHEMLAGAVDLALTCPEGCHCLGFGGKHLVHDSRTVSSGAKLFQELTPSDSGLFSGYDDLRSFENPGVRHIDLQFSGV
mmetsp:Transcript_65197/g.172754  ORF Transcript_65197/g.172754 Transcript_65197/m.172754 type:complete len:428 (-) Transcript_65197:183-1466(-)|eukprot:CAMPEP_0194547782 /NCGR_PEP_ID=MMETSP0253-20130528/92639_1 /TAXON_ID=2966 /ORGANISM="Noctiluca scintillans" /LENGTH=427 /DNA_ID=CAMNT_0039395025 /DNA_START=40 /DNA_END=1323 /DNA_ORIENTATION=+